MKNLYEIAGLVPAGKDEEGEMEYIGTDKQWKRYQELEEINSNHENHEVREEGCEECERKWEKESEE